MKIHIKDIGEVSIKAIAKKSAFNASMDII